MSARRKPLSHATLAKQLRALSCQMFEVAVRMEYAAADDAELAQHARELCNASVMAKRWADDIAAPEMDAKVAA